MYSEFEVKRQIESISNSEDPPLRKARRLIHLSRDIRRFSVRLDHGAVILRRDEDESGADRLQQTLNCLNRLQEEARLAAFKALKSQPRAMGFQVKAERLAYPARWMDTKEHLDAQPTYN
jgi:hypothetical protein